MKAPRFHLLRLAVPLFLGLLLLAALGGASLARGQDPSLRFGGQIPADVDTIYDRGLAYLAAAQDQDGSWKGPNQGAGVTGICLMAFLASGEDPNYGKYAGNIHRAIYSIIHQQDATTGYLPNSMYHHGFAMLALSEAYGAVDESLFPGGKKPPRSIAKALQLAIGCAATSQKKNSMGGWRYNPDASDADTSVTGAVLMGLLAARNAGMDVPDDVVSGAMDFMRRSTGSDGSVAYTGGFGGMEGSMNLTAVAALTGAVSKTKGTDQYKASLKRLLDNLDTNQPGPYIEYFRYYMAQALFQGDYAAWQKWNAGQVRELRDTQHDDGSFGGSYQTGMSLLALALNYRFLPIYER
jgi:hypothetical protein